MIVRRIISVICTAAMMASIVMSSYAVSPSVADTVKSEWQGRWIWDT